MHASGISPGLCRALLIPRNPIRSFCAIAYLEFASCFDCELDGKVNSSRTLQFIVEKVACHVLASLRVLSSSNIVFPSGYLLNLVLFTPSSSSNSSFSQPFSFLSTSSHYFHPSSATALCTSILIIGKLLVHTLCILHTFCSHCFHLATHLRHHQNSLCKITAASSPLRKNCSQVSVSSTASTSSLSAVLYLEHILSIAVSRTSQCCLHIILMGGDCRRLPRNSHTKSEPFLSTMQKNMSRKSTNVHESSSSIPLSFQATYPLYC